MVLWSSTNPATPEIGHNFARLRTKMAANLASCSCFCNISIPKNVSRKRTQVSTRAVLCSPVMEPRTRKLASTSNGQSKKLRPTNQSDGESDLSSLRTLCSYVNSRRFEDALHLFDEMSHPDVSAWNVMIKGFTDNGMFQEAVDFHRRMEIEGFSGDKLTYPFVIKACAGLLLMMEGQRVHGKVLKSGLYWDVYICNSLISMYAKLGCLGLAEKVFDEMPVRDLVSWNSMISGYLLDRDIGSSFSCLQEMLAFGVKPDRFTMISALGISSATCCLQHGKEIHCQIIRNGFESDIKAQTSLIDMYSRCKRIGYAERLFNSISKKNVVVWNAMIGGYAMNHRAPESFACLERMKEAGRTIIPDAITAINILSSCAQEKSLKEGKAVHGYAIRKGFLPRFTLEIALVDMYSRCKRIGYAERLFNSISQKNVVLWNAMIGGYAMNRWAPKSFACLKRMQAADNQVIPNVITALNILPSCALAKSLRKGKAVHGYAIRKGFLPHITLETALVDMYGHCEELKSAEHVFYAKTEKDLASWNAMITVYVQNGWKSEGLELFRNLLLEGLQPDIFTVTSIVPAYVELSSLAEVRQMHSLVMKLEFNSSIHISNSVVSMYAKCDDLESARKYFDGMIHKDVDSWNAIIMAHAIRGLGRIAIELFSSMEETPIKPNAKTYYALLLACKTSGLVAEGLDYFNSMILGYGIDPEVEHFQCMVGLLGETKQP